MFTEQFPDLLHGTAMPANQFHQFPDKFIRLFMLMDIYTSLFRNIKTETLFFCRHTYIPEFFLPGFRQMLQAMKHLFFSLLHVKKVIQRGQGIV